jgi:tRNA-splicing ligase RtcB
MITGKILKLRGWPEGKITGLAKAAAVALAESEDDQEAILLALDLVRMMPGEYLTDPILGDLARECLRRTQPQPAAEDLRDHPLPYPTWGDEQIDPGAKAQMDNALRLPVAVAGALMPDAHVGYGLPIGGVLATDSAVIPFAVGVDIACRMRLSIYDAPPEMLGQRKEQFSRALMEQTRFGSGAAWEKAHRPKHPVLDDPAWSATPLLKSLQSKAQEQLGTSGTGNHFVEWGILRLPVDDPALGLKAGEYLALLSHSGSRGVGFKIANTYTEIARRLHPTLDQSLRHLSWLPLDHEAGQEYWLSMELAGRFASANHYIIHHRVAGAVGLKEIAHVENHHNFAWKETLPDGTNAIVHRKGATPAGPGVLGIIPGSMGDAGYLVRGKGVASSLNSAAHGAGRKMSRRGALQTISKKERDAYLRERGIILLGGGLDESPQAYKNIEEVLAAQDDLIDIVGKFTPRIVRMANEPGDIYSGDQNY